LELYKFLPSEFEGARVYRYTHLIKTHYYIKNINTSWTYLKTYLKHLSL